MGINRRAFLGSVAACGVAMTANKSALSFNEKADMAVVKGNNPTKITDAAINALGGMSKFVKPGSSIFVKPNASWAMRPQQAINTNPEVMGAVVAQCIAAGAAKVVVADNTLHDAERSYEMSGIGQATKEAGGEVHFVKETEFVEMETGGKILGKWPVYKPALESDLIINVPVAKHHFISTLTAGMKNMMGLISGNREVFHDNMDEAIVDMAEFFKPQLTIIDAVRVLYRNGPKGGNVADTKVLNTVIASTDVVAADTKAAMVMGFDPAEVGHLQVGNDRKLGTNDLSKINIVEINL